MLKVHSIYQKMMQLKCCFYWQQSVALDRASLIICRDPLKVPDQNDWWPHCTLPMSHTYMQTNQGNQLRSCSVLLISLWRAQSVTLVNSSSKRNVKSSRIPDHLEDRMSFYVYVMNFLQGLCCASIIQF